MSDLVDLNPAHFAIVEQILAEHVPECEVRAYGSCAKWDVNDASDLNLVVVGDKPLPSQTLAMLKEAFMDSRLPMRVDVVAWNVIADSIRELIGLGTVVVQDALPPGAREVAIPEFADIMGNGAPSTENPKGFDGTIPWLTSNDLSGTHDRYLECGERNLSQQRLDSSLVKLIPPGSMLPSTRAPVGYVALVKNRIVLNYLIPDGIAGFVLANEFSSSKKRFANTSTFSLSTASSMSKHRRTMMNRCGKDHPLIRSMEETADRIAAVNR